MSKKPEKSRKHKKYRSSKEGEWDLLDKTAETLTSYAMSPVTLLPILKNEKAIESVEDKSLLFRRVRTLSEDATKLAKDLMEIRAEHQGLKGSPKTPDDHMKCVDLYFRYTEWVERYEAIAQPTFNAIAEQLATAGGVDFKELSEKYEPASEKIEKKTTEILEKNIKHISDALRATIEHNRTNQIVSVESKEEDQ